MMYEIVPSITADYLIAEYNKRAANTGVYSRLSRPTIEKYVAYLTPLGTLYIATRLSDGSSCRFVLDPDGIRKVNQNLPRYFSEILATIQ